MLLIPVFALLASLSFIGHAFAGTTSAVEDSSSPGKGSSIAKGASQSKIMVKPLSVEGNDTTPSSGLHSLFEYPDYSALILCTSPACEGTCEYYALSEISEYPYTCFYPYYEYESAFIYSIGGYGLPYGIYAALYDCEEPTQLYSVNTCYNVLYYGESYPFSTFYVT